MLLIPIDQWRKKYFVPDAAPSISRIQRHLRTHKLPGRKVGGQWHVDLDQWLAHGDPLVERVLSER